MDEARVALLGFGRVGQAVARAALEEPGVARGLRIVAVADHAGWTHRAEGLDLAALLATKRAGPVGPAGTARGLLDAHGPELDLVAELTPTDLRDGRAALGRVEAALRAGCDVASANKAPFALHWRRVHDAAARSGARVRCSATVCGGVPVLELGGAAFRGDRLLRVEGVLNGSTNHILSALERGRELEDALRDARGRGLLEADASLDLLGTDARAKACILANALFGRSLTLADVPGEGILGVTRRGAQEAARRGMALRLVARVDGRGAGVRVVELPREHPLRTEGAENAVRLTYALAGPVTLRGAGAGPREAASAVLSDLRVLAAGRAARAAAAPALTRAPARPPRAPRA